MVGPREVWNREGECRDVDFVGQQYSRTLRSAGGAVESAKRRTIGVVMVVFRRFGIWIEVYIVGDAF